MAPDALRTSARRNRLGTWLVTGPVGRFLGFWLDLALVMIGLVRERITRRP
jgi:hypothetical protein